jgi:hypothetical protein
MNGQAEASMSPSGLQVPLGKFQGRAVPEVPLVRVQQRPVRIEHNAKTKTASQRPAVRFMPGNLGPAGGDFGDTMTLHLGGGNHPTFWFRSYTFEQSGGTAFGVTVRLRTEQNMLFILTFFCLAVASPVFAQTSGAENYPNRGVRIVVPFPPGGPTDTYARILADKLQTALGQSFVVENNPRATGLIGMLFVANAPADGYTLLLGANSSHVISSLLQPQRPLDPLKVFRPLSMLLSYPLYLLLNKDGAGRDRCRAGGAWQVEAGQIEHG